MKWIRIDWEPHYTGIETCKMRRAWGELTLDKLNYVELYLQRCHSTKRLKFIRTCWHLPVRIIGSGTIGMFIGNLNYSKDIHTGVELFLGHSFRISVGKPSFRLWHRRPMRVKYTGSIDKMFANTLVSFFDLIAIGFSTPIWWQQIKEDEWIQKEEKWMNQFEDDDWE